MPCQDISEIIDLQLDGDGCLRAYTLNKRTCGADIGTASLLLDKLGGYRAEAIVDLSNEAMFALFPNRRQQDAFLYAKHFLALREALRVMIGWAPGGVDAACAVLSVETTPPEGDMHFRGVVAIDTLGEKIKACGNCGSCGSHRLPSAQ